MSSGTLKYLTILLDEVVVISCCTIRSLSIVYLLWSLLIVRIQLSLFKDSVAITNNSYSVIVSDESCDSLRVYNALETHRTEKCRLYKIKI